jgi:LPXTG-site transpeptidase (sortase) family protein
LGGNTALAGHVTVRNYGNGPFRYLDQLASGDEVRLYTERKVYTYRVREQQVVSENDLWVTQPTQNNQLVLITCTDWNADFQTYIRRLVVFADLEKSEVLIQSGMK